MDFELRESQIALLKPANNGEVSLINQAIATGPSMNGLYNAARIKIGESIPDDLNSRALIGMRVLALNNYFHSKVLPPSLDPLTTPEELQKLVCQAQTSLAALITDPM